VARQFSMFTLIDRSLKTWHVGVLNGAAIAWFAAITFTARLALPQVSFFRCPIGLCLTGYTANDATLMLRLIGEEGRIYLERVLLPMDRIMPALLVAALVATILRLTRTKDRVAIPLGSWYRLMLISVPLFYCVADYAENWAHGEMVRAYPNISYRLVARASILTALKSQLVAASISIAAALAIAALLRARRSP
jgi:hypothetical protein